MAHSPCLYLPLLLPLSSPLYPLLLTWNPPSCDRNRPPRSQVACKLTPFAPPFTQLSPPSKFPEPNCPAPYYDDLGNIPDPFIRNSRCPKICDEVLATKIKILKPQNFETLEFFVVKNIFCNSFREHFICLNSAKNSQFSLKDFSSKKPYPLIREFFNV